MSKHHLLYLADVRRVYCTKLYNKRYFGKNKHVWCDTIFIFSRQLNEILRHFRWWIQLTVFINLKTWTCQLWFQLLKLHLCPEVLVLGTLVPKHYNVTSIVEANIVGCIALQGNAEMTTLMDNTIDEMQFRCFAVSASHSQASKTYILTLKSSFNVTEKLWIGLFKIL